MGDEDDKKEKKGCLGISIEDDGDDEKDASGALAISISTIALLVAANGGCGSDKLDRSAVLRLLENPDAIRAVRDSLESDPGFVRKVAGKVADSRALQENSREWEKIFTEFLKKNGLKIVPAEQIDRSKSRSR